MSAYKLQPFSEIEDGAGWMKIFVWRMLFALQEYSFDVLPSESAAEWFTNMCLGHPLSLAAIEEGQPVGGAFFFELGAGDFPMRFKTATNFGFFVDESHRGPRGPATPLVKELLKRAKAGDWERVSLYVHPENKKSMGLARYAKLEEQKGYMLCRLR